MKAVRITDSIAYRIYRCSRVLRKHFLELGHRNRLDLTPEQWFVLNKLHWQDGQSQTELSDAIFADRPNMSRIINSLEQQGYVRRKDDAEDSRKLRVFLTAEGRRTHDLFAELVPATRTAVFRGIDREEIAIVERVLEQLERNLLADLSGRDIE
jgi:MarR family transcriptional regulator, transcriptional regulator for hemolysin